MSTVSIVGTINYDRIILPDGASRQGLGGILYNLLALAPFSNSSTAILPIARVGAERRRQVELLAAPHGAIDLQHMLWDPAGTNETVLTYRTNDVREEALIERAAPLKWKEIVPAAAADWVVVNLISGKELTVGLFQKLAAASGGSLFLDIQSLTLTFGKGSHRGYKAVPDWKMWLAGVETVKGNEAEMRAMVGEESAPFDGDLPELAKMLLAAGPAAAIITRGTDGHAIAWRRGRKSHFVEADAVALPQDSLVDTTGCGDVFLSGYLLGRLRGEDPLPASLLGASLAASSCRLQGVADLGRLQEPSALRDQAYAGLLARADGGDSGPAV